MLYLSRDVEKKEVSFGTGKYKIAGLGSLTTPRPSDTPLSSLPCVQEH